MRLQIWAALAVAGGLSACAGQAPSRPDLATAPPRPGPPEMGARALWFQPEPLAVPDLSPPATGAFAALQGWAQDDHAAALAAFAATCGAARSAEAATVCRRAQALGPQPESVARAFLETNFRPEPVAESGLLTAYFMPIYEARTQPDDEFRAPVRPRPADLPAQIVPGDYPDRAQIEARQPNDAVAWMRPEELFFLQVQGSGVLLFPDGVRQRAVFDGTNGAPFVGIAAPLRRQGLLADSATSGEAIRTWLAANRGPRAQAIMQLNPRYVFFRLRADDGGEPAGAAGVPLVAGRAVAVDPSRHAMGDLVWIDATSPVLSGAFPCYRRLVVALDTGGAIKGEARADLYMGRGSAAGVEAGRVRHVLRLYRLTPIGRAGA